MHIEIQINNSIFELIVWLRKAWKPYWHETSANFIDVLKFKEPKFLN